MTRIDRAKYAGELAATKFPDLTGRFQFWCGGSGRRYATSRYLPGQTPAYDLAVSLYVKRTEAGPKVIAIAAGLADQTAPADADEVHVHLVERIEALAFAHRDLRVLLDGGNAPGTAPEGTTTSSNVIPFIPRRAA
jgi:hypothetical protein